MIVAFDLETEMIPARRTVLSRGGKPTKVSPYVTPRPVIASTAYATSGRVWDMDEFYGVLADWVHEGVTILCHNGASFDLDVLYTHGPAELRPVITKALDDGLIIDTKILDWLVRLAEGTFDMPVYNPATRKWSVPQPQVRSLAALAREFFGVELDKDPAVRCGYAQFLGARPSPARALPEKFRVYAEQDAVMTYRVGVHLLRRADSIAPRSGDSALFGPLSAALQARASFVAHQMDKQGVHIDQARAVELHSLFEADEEPLQDRLVAFGLGRYKPVPKAPRVVEDNLPLDTEDILEWRKV